MRLLKDGVWQIPFIYSKLDFYLVGFSNEYTLTRFKDSLSNFDIHFIKKTGSLFIQSRNNSAGNWSIDITTKKHKIYMNPLETINVQKINEVRQEESTI